MVDGAAVVLFSVAMGFVTAGICNSTYGLITNSALRFEKLPGGGGPALVRAVLLVVAGPTIIVRNSWRAAREGMRPLFWVLASALLASAWSFCLGVAVLNVAVIAGT